VNVVGTNDSLLFKRYLKFKLSLSVKGQENVRLNARMSRCNYQMSVRLSEITEHQHDLMINRPVWAIFKNPGSGDKSISHRALMLGAIAQGETQIQGLLLGEDPHPAASCFRAMGAEISELIQNECRLKVLDWAACKSADVLNAGNSGTTLRLMLVLASIRDACL